MRQLHSIRGIGFWKWIHQNDPVPLHKGKRYVGQGRRFCIYTYGDCEKGETLTTWDNDPPAYTLKPKCKGAKRSCFSWALCKTDERFE